MKKFDTKSTFYFIVGKLLMFFEKFVFWAPCSRFIILSIQSLLPHVALLTIIRSKDTQLDMKPSIYKGICSRGPGRSGPLCNSPLHHSWGLQ